MARSGSPKRGEASRRAAKARAMSYQQLLAWVQVGRLEDSKAPEVLELVEAALDDLGEDDPRYDALVDIEEELLEGQVPIALLQELVKERSPSEQVDDVVRLEREYRAIAAAYTPEQWQSNFYLDLEHHLEESDDDELLEFVDSLRQRLTRVWNKYETDYNGLSEHSAETVVGHTFMKEGYETWMKALDLVDADTDDEEILETAEAAVRLLIAVGQLDRDVRMQAGSLGAPTFQKGC